MNQLALSHPDSPWLAFINWPDKDIVYKPMQRREFASLDITPADLQQATGIRSNPLPQTSGELGKQLKDGASESMNVYKDVAKEVYEDLIKDVKDVNTIRSIFNYLPWTAPLILKGSSKEDEPNTK